MRVLKKNKLCFVTLSLVFFSQPALPSTSLMVSGHAGITGEYSVKNPPTESSYLGIRVPVGLTLSASPSDNLNIYLGLDYAYNNYPQTPLLLGQTSSSSTSNDYGQATPMPFSNTINAQSGGTSFGQKTDTPVLTTAYFTYQTSVGLLKAGRMPRNWGLGLWYSNEWTPTGGTVSTSDALAFTTDLNLFDATAYYERFGTSIGGTSGDQDAIAYTIEARLKLDPADAPSSGVTREIGVLFSIFNHDQSNTTLNIIDFYGKIYLSKFFIGAEVLYPKGSSQNPNYQSLGGGPDCHTTSSSSPVYTQTCNSQDYSAIAGL